MVNVRGSLTEVDLMAIEEKEMSPEQDVFCPRCGQCLILQEANTSYTIKCETRNCITYTCRGI